MSKSVDVALQSELIAVRQREEALRRENHRLKAIYEQLQTASDRVDSEIIAACRAGKSAGQSQSWETVAGPMLVCCPSAGLRSLLA
jgi:hypothetical protein